MADDKKDYKRPGRIPFECKGIDVNHAPDGLRESGKYPYIKNVVCTVDGIIEVRSGLTTQYSSGAGAGHSCRRLNDSSSGSMVWARVHGVGTAVRMEQSSAPGSASALVGAPVFSGNPLSLTSMRPQKTPQPWMYIGDTLTMIKVRANSLTPHSIGMPRPIGKLATFVETATFKTIDLFETIGGWVAVGGVGAVGAAAARVNTVVNRHAERSLGGTTGAQTVIEPNSMANIGVGTVLTMQKFSGGTDDVLITQINKESPVTATILRIVYETGIARFALVLDTPSREVQVGSLIYNSTRLQLGIIENIIVGPDNTLCVEVFSASTTWAAADTVYFPRSFVCEPLNTSVPFGGGTLTSNHVPFTTAAAGSTKFDKTIALDLSSMTQYGRTVGLTLEDLMHISLRADKPDLITELKLFLDIDAAGGGVGTTFTQNYYVISISQSDFTPVTKGTQSALDNRTTQVRRRVGEHPPFVRRDRIVNPGDEVGGFGDPNAGGYSAPPFEPVDPSHSRLSTGDNQFSEIRFPLSAMTKVGNDNSRGLKDVCAIRIEAITTGVVILSADSWVIEGGYPVDATDLENGIQYTYRFRSSLTGAVSDIAAISGVTMPRRQRVALTNFDAAPVTEADKIDLFRIGGTLDVLSYFATMNVGTSSYFDTTGDDVARNIADADGTFNQDDPDDQPWITAGLPVSGTCTAAGTYLSSAAAFDLKWAAGTLINVLNGSSFTSTTIKRVMTTSLLEVEHHCGTGLNTSFEIPQPFKTGQPLLMFGSYKEFIFALSDPRNPGTLYWTKHAKPDTTSLKRSLKITTGSEVLQNGFVFNQRPGVFSDQRLFYLDYAPFDELNGPFIPHVSVGIPGLYAKWAFDVDQRRGVAFLANDGVYLLGPDGIKDISSRDLQPLFPYQGRPGRDVVVAPINQGGSAITFKAPYMPSPVGAEEKFLRLCFGEDDMLYFFYRDNAATLHCMFYDFDLDGWFPYEYRKPLAFVYSEEGPGLRSLVGWGTDTTFYTIGGDADDGTDAGLTISCEVRTPSYDYGDPRADKQFGDIHIDVDPGGATVAVVPGYNNHTATLTGTNISGSGRIDPPTLIDLSSGGGKFARNASLDLSWTNASNNRPKLYLWEPSFITHPEVTQLRASDYEFISESLLYVRGFWIEADTRIDAGGSAQIRTVDVNYIDHTGAAQTFTITNVNHFGKVKIFYPVASPFYASTMRFRATDIYSWKLYKIEPVGEPAPDYSSEPSPWTVFEKLMYVRGFWFDADTFNNVVPITLSWIDQSGLLQSGVLSNGQHNGRSKIFYPLSAPLYISTFRLFSANKWILFKAEIEGEPAPPFGSNPSPWTDDGEIGNKWLQGAVLDIDTHSGSISVRIEGDEGVALQTFPNIVAAQRSQVHVNLNPAKMTHLMRAFPLGAAHLFDVKWFWQSEAELADYFEAQPQAGDLPGFKHLREVWIAYENAASAITLTITTDRGAIAGIPQIPLSATYNRVRILIPAFQFKWYKPTISSATKFRLDRAGCEFHMKGWAVNGDYQIMQPFGFPRHDRGVAID